MSPIEMTKIERTVMSPQIQKNNTNNIINSLISLGSVRSFEKI